MTNLPPFDINLPSFSLKNARSAVAAIRLAYDDPSNCGIGGVQIFDCGGYIVVAFEGTHNLTDWLTDFDFVKVPGPAGLVHRGAWRRHVAQRDMIHNRLAELGAGPNKPVVWEGHSLGAWLAEYGAVDSTFAVAAVYLAEMPRGGDPTYRNFYNAFLGKKTFSITLEEDIVCRVPFWLLNYRHVGRRIFFPSNRRDYIENPSLCRFIVSDLIGEFRAWQKGGLKALLANPISDHPLKRIEARLAQLTP